MTIVNTSLTTAVIYPDRACLTRSGKISLKRGKHQLEIKVRLENSQPKPSAQTELNILEWNLDLIAGGKQTIRFDFEIEYPQKMRLSSIGRRDKDLDDILF